MHKDQNYNSSLALMKLSCAFLIILLHALSHGGALANAQIHTYNYYILWTIESFAYVAVNVFMISSGFFQVCLKRDTSKVMAIIFEVLFYTILAFAISFLFNHKYTLNDIYYTIFPVSNEVYGFITAYLAVYLLSPIINNYIHSQSNRNKITSTLVFAILCSLYPTVKVNTDYIGLNFGASFIWYAYMYYVGGVLRTLEVDCEMKHNTSSFHFLLYCSFSVFSIVIGFICKEISLANSFSFNGEGVLLHYNSSTVLIASISFFMMFRYMKIPRIKHLNAFKVLTSTTLGIYLFHDNYLIRNNIWTYLRGHWEFYNVLLCALIVFLITILIDIIRQILFEVLHISSICENIVSHIKVTIRFTTEKLFALFSRR